MTLILKIFLLILEVLTLMDEVFKVIKLLLTLILKTFLLMLMMF